MVVGVQVLRKFVLGRIRAEEHLECESFSAEKCAQSLAGVMFHF